MLLQSVPSAPTNLEAVITSTRYTQSSAFYEVLGTSSIKSLGVLYFKHLAKPTNTVSTPIHPGSSPSLGRVRQTRMGRLPAIPSSTSRKTQRGREWSTQRGERWKKSLCRVFSQARCTASELSHITNTVPASPVPPWRSPPSPRWRCRGLRATWLQEPRPPSPFS